MFPEVDHVRYQNCQIEKVICQFRFPPILKINSEIPSSFQESIRSSFPFFEERFERKINFPIEISNEIPSAFLPFFSDINTKKNYSFLSKDKKVFINLTDNFISFTTNGYEHWGSFIEQIQGPLNKFIEIYNPNSFNRIGLRYINKFDREKMGLISTPWSDLFRNIVSIPSFEDKNYENNIIQFSSNLILRIDEADKISVRILHGIEKDVENNKKFYLLDNDFFADGEKELSDSVQTINNLNRYARNLFRWCITDKLHESMGPIQIK